MVFNAVHSAGGACVSLQCHTRGHRGRWFTAAWKLCQTRRPTLSPKIIPAFARAEVSHKKCGVFVGCAVSKRQMEAPQGSSRSSSPEHVWCSLSVPSPHSLLVSGPVIWPHIYTTFTFTLSPSHLTQLFLDTLTPALGPAEDQESFILDLFMICAARLGQILFFFSFALFEKQ